MKTELQSISKIFTERLFRIPDYQRGYAWTRKQIKEFWSDLMQLEPGHNHYVGVLTLEDVPEEVFKHWKEDYWIINSKNYRPYYVVDGQQRLTTAIIFIESIAEVLSDDDSLNYTSKAEIRKKFIFDTKDGGISRSYIFGYEKDNPSYEYLKRNIFNEISDSSDLPQETIYTHNLFNAKNFFKDELSRLSRSSLESAYKKITQNFLFNIYSISEDIDTYVAFETMNNRGKPLSHLELLKNRLIYLSTRIDNEEYEKNKLRSSINEAWKSVYHFLGKNKEKPLDDDLFLLNHFVLYFASSLSSEEDRYLDPFALTRDFRWSYKEYLLETYFSARSVSGLDSEGNSIPKGKKLTINNIYDYVKSLKNSVETWYQIINPEDSAFSSEVKEWLMKINRLGMDSVAPFIMVFVQNCDDKKLLLKMLTAVERHLFLMTLVVGRYYYDHRQLLLTDIAGDLSSKKITCREAVDNVNDKTELFKKQVGLTIRIKDSFKERGFYKWDAIRYFFFEYEQKLQKQSKNHRRRLEWATLNENYNDYSSIEHIYPQNSQKHHWSSKFRDFTTKERNLLRHSLGNLLALSKPKNSSLQDKSFEEKKVVGANGVGYANGSYSEIEVSAYLDWTAREILERGLKLLSFMEERWLLDFGSKHDKIEILGLKSVSDKL